MLAAALEWWRRRHTASFLHASEIQLHPNEERADLPPLSLSTRPSDLPSPIHPLLLPFLLPAGLHPLGWCVCLTSPHDLSLVHRFTFRWINADRLNTADYCVHVQHQQQPQTKKQKTKHHKSLSHHCLQLADTLPDLLICKLEDNLFSRKWKNCWMSQISTWKSGSSELLSSRMCHFRVAVAAAVIYRTGQASVSLFSEATLSGCDRS